MGVGFARSLSIKAIRTRNVDEVAPAKKPSMWRDGLNLLFGAPTPADRAMQAEREAERKELCAAVDWRDRVEEALVREGYALPRAPRANTLAVAGPLRDYASRLGLVEPHLSLHVDLDDTFSVSLSASRYRRSGPTLREGCPGLVRLVEDAVGARVKERFETI